MNHQLDAADRADYDATLAAVRAQLDEASFQAAWQEGSALPLAKAVAYAHETSG